MMTIIAASLRSHTLIPLEAKHNWVSEGQNPTNKIAFGVFICGWTISETLCYLGAVHFLHINALRYSKICDAASFYSFLIFCLCSCFPLPFFLVPRWFHFLSPCPACLLKQIQAHLLWWRLCLELKIDPETRENVMRKRIWMQTSGTFVARFCTLCFPEVDVLQLY